MALNFNNLNLRRILVSNRSKWISKEDIRDALLPDIKSIVDRVEEVGSTSGNTFESKTFVLNAAGESIAGSDAGITLINPGANPTIRVTTTKKLKLGFFNTHSKAIQINFSGIPDVFTAGEEAIGQTSGAIGVVARDLGGGIYVFHKSGTFQIGETVIGQTSSSEGIIDGLSYFLSQCYGQSDGVLSALNSIGGNTNTFWNFAELANTNVIIGLLDAQIMGVDSGWTGAISAINPTSFDITLTQVGAGLDITGTMHLIEG
jgi:hypothetical protein